MPEQPPYDSPQNMPVNPLIGDYKTKDNRWVTLTMLQPGRYWADTCRHLGLDHLIEDPRFDSAEKLMANADEAGAYLGEVFRTKTLVEWREVLATNLVAPALVTAAALPHLTSEGFVAFLSSEGVGAPYPGLVPYTASKAGLEELVRGLRAEEPDVRFACVKVGTTDGTEFARSFDPELAAELLPTWVALGKIPARMMQPEELGGAILRTLAVALTHPGVDCQDLTFRAPGGPHLGGIEQLLASVAAAAGS